MRIIVISDTHQYYRNFETIVLRNPDADMFLHLGDGESEYQLLCRTCPKWQTNSAMSRATATTAVMLL